MVKHTKLITSLGIAVLLVILPHTAWGQEWVESSAIVRIQLDINIDSLAAAHDFEVLDSLAGRHVAFFHSILGLDVSTIIEFLETLPPVLHVEPNYILGDPESQQKSEGFVDITNPEFEQGISPVAYYQQAANDQIGLTTAHDHTTGAGVVVAVIDNGVDYSHPALQSNLAGTPLIPYDFVDGDLDPSEEPGGDAYGHGTFVSSIIALAAPDVMLLPLRVLDQYGSGTAFNLAEAIYYAVSMNVDLINMSLGYPEECEAVNDAVAYALSMGVCCVASAGNGDTDSISYPAVNSEVIAVTAVDSLDQKADFANYGDWIDIVAPGVELYAALPDSQFGWWGGTSFGCALVSGTMALLHSLDPNIDCPEMYENLLQSTDNIDSENPGYSGLLGSGRLNSAMAVWYALGMSRPFPLENAE